MKPFRLVVLGENFLVKEDGRPVRRSFRAVRFVEAADAVEARERAVSLMRRQLEGLVLNAPADSPVLFVEESLEADPGTCTEAGQGFEWSEESLPAARVVSPRASRYVFTTTAA
jgi:hypothetical protein